MPSGAIHARRHLVARLGLYLPLLAGLLAMHVLLLCHGTAEAQGAAGRHGGHALAAPFEARGYGHTSAPHVIIPLAPVPVAPHGPSPLEMCLAVVAGLFIVAGVRRRGPATLGGGALVGERLLPRWSPGRGPPPYLTLVLCVSRT